MHELNAWEPTLGTTDEENPGLRGPANDLESHFGSAPAAGLGRDVRDYSVDATVLQETAEDLEALGIRVGHSATNEVLESDTVDAHEIGSPSGAADASSGHSASHGPSQAARHR